MIQNLLKKPQPTTSEFFVALIIIFIAISAFTIIDINIFNSYVLPELEANPGDLYWATLNGIVVFVGGSIAILRFSFGIMAGSKLTLNLVIISLLWGFSVVILFYFGWLDSLYYQFQGLDIPDALPWLNSVGVFIYTKAICGDVNLVERCDLLYTNVIGFLALIGFWAIFISCHWKRVLIKF